MQRIVKISLALIGFIYLSACSNSGNDSVSTESIVHDTSRIIRSTWSPSQSALRTIKVINELNQALVGAQILVGDSVNSPFVGNFVKTNKEGVATIPASWTKEAHVTIDAAGYIRQTMLDQAPGDLIIKMGRVNNLASSKEVKGNVTELPVENGDGKVDFALVMPTFSRLDMLNFSLDLAISPISETINVANRSVDVPVNLTLPTQTERYLFFNVTLSKPLYSLNLPSSGKRTLYAASGRFPFKQVVDELNNGKSFYDLINSFTLTGGSLREVNLNAPSVNLDIPANELKFSAPISLKAPPAQRDEALIMVATSEIVSSLVPTDLKRTTGGQAVTLNTLPNKPQHIVSVLKRQSEMNSDAVGADRLSASILAAKKYQPILLALVDNPSVRNNSGFEINLPTPPVVPNTLNPLATTAVISDIVNITPQSKTYVRKWEIVGLNWQRKIQLPNWPLAGNQTKKRIEINFIASNTQSSVRLDDDVIKATTHITHSSTEY